MTTQTEYLEQSNRILASTDTRSFDELRREVESLEARFSTRCRDAGDRAQLAESIADLHLTLAVLKKQPVATCLPLAERVLETSEPVPFRGLQSIGVFARYALACDPGVGLRMLERALERVDWAGTDIELPREAQSAYERLVRRLREAAGA